jgi:PTS system ascorbate-specific IIA component
LANQTLQNVTLDGLLVLTDIFGATPANVAQKVVGSRRAKLIAGANVPMLFRAVSYRHESLDDLVARALAGGTQGVMQVAIAAPQIQTPRSYDHQKHHHQQ